jgi:hypothetical protein
MAKLKEVRALKSSGVDRLRDFVSDRSGKLAHGSDAVGTRQLALYLAVLPLAPSALQGNGGLRSEVPEDVIRFPLGAPGGCVGNGPNSR